MDLLAAEKNIKVIKKRLDKIMGNIDAAIRLLSTPIEKSNGHTIPVEGYGAMPEPVKKTRKPREKGGKWTPMYRQQRLQGRYLGHMKQLTEAQRKKVSAFREKHGFVKAIALAKRLQD